MARKPSGEGTYWREDKLWCWKRRVGPRGLQRTFVVKENDYTAFRARVDEEQQKIKRMGKGAAIAPKALGVNPLLSDWLEAFLRPPHRSRSTYKSYKNAWERRLKPRFGSQKVSRLTDVEIQNWLNEEIPSRSLEIALILLTKFLAYCQGKGYIHVNPAENLTAPEYQAKDGYALTPEEMSRLLKEAYRHIAGGHGARLKPTGTVIYSGSFSDRDQINEALGLKITEIDQKEGTAAIAKQLAYDGESGFTRQDLKTANARRTLVLEPEALKAIRHQQRMIARERKIARDGSEENLYLFPTEAGTPQFARNITRTLEKIVERADLPGIGLHDLRRTCLTNLANRGMPMHQLQKYAGHASITTTAKYYLKATLDAQRAAIRGLRPLEATTTKTVALRPREEKKA